MNRLIRPHGCRKDVEFPPDRCALPQAAQGSAPRVEYGTIIPSHPLGVEILPPPRPFARPMTSPKKERSCLVASSPAYCRATP